MDHVPTTYLEWGITQAAAHKGYRIQATSRPLSGARILVPCAFSRMGVDLPPSSYLRWFDTNMRILSGLRARFFRIVIKQPPAIIGNRHGAYWYMVFEIETDAKGRYKSPLPTRDHSYVLFA